MLELFIKYHGPIGLREAGKAKVMRFARSKSSRDPSRLIDEIFEALSQQSVSVSGTGAVELVIPMLALNIKTLKAQRVEVAQQVEKLLANYPLLEVLGVHSRSGHQMRSHDTPLRRRWLQLSNCRPPRVIRRDSAGHSAIGILDQRREPL